MSDIHRLLDEAFSGVTMTPELQDLKEELRGNLAARADELQAGGADASAAAATAVAELDLPGLIAGLDAEAPAAPASPGAAAAELARLHRVRQKPGFVVRACICAVALLAGASFFAASLAHDPFRAQFFAIGFGVVLAFLVADSLRQETSQHFPMPSARAVRWGLAGGLLAVGLGYGGLFAAHLGDLASLVAGVVLALAGAMGLVALGVTQTNRTKPWALAQRREYEAADRFSQDPAAAARFGIYTVIIWIAAIAAFIVLSIAVGFAWSWLALVVGVLVFFLVLTRMLFAPEHGPTKQ